MRTLLKVCGGHHDETIMCFINGLENMDITFWDNRRNLNTGRNKGRALVHFLNESSNAKQAEHGDISTRAALSL